MPIFNPLQLLSHCTLTVLIPEIKMYVSLIKMARQLRLFILLPSKHLCFLKEMQILLIFCDLVGNIAQNPFTNPALFVFLKIWFFDMCSVHQGTVASNATVTVSKAPCYREAVSLSHSLCPWQTYIGCSDGFNGCNRGLLGRYNHIIFMHLMDTKHHLSMPLPLSM